MNNFSTLAARRVRCRRRKKSSPRACAASSTTYASRRISSAATSKGTIGNHQQERWFGKSCAVERAIFLQKLCEISIFRVVFIQNLLSPGVFTRGFHRYRESSSSLLSPPRIVIDIDSRSSTWQQPSPPSQPPLCAFAGDTLMWRLSALHGAAPVRARLDGAATHWGPQRDSFTTSFVASIYQSRSCKKVGLGCKSNLAALPNWPFLIIREFRCEYWGSSSPFRILEYSRILGGNAANARINETNIGRDLANNQERPTCRPSVWNSKSY